MLLDNAVHCLTLSSLLLKEKELKVVGACSNVQMASEKLHQHRPKYLILDPEALSLEDYRQVIDLARQQQFKVIVFSKNSAHAWASAVKYVSKPEKLVAQSMEFRQLLAVIRDELPVSLGPSQPAPGKAGGVRVMLVDDSRLMLATLKRILQKRAEWVVVGEFSNGREALAALETVQPDLILLDLEMPVMDGLSFLRQARIRSQAQVAVLSSVAMMGSTKATEARRLGAAAVMAKPSGAVSLDLEERVGQELLEPIAEVLRS